MFKCIAISAICAAIPLIPATIAQAGPIERQEIFRSELASCAGTQVVVAKLQVAPSATIPRHAHNGDEHLLVLSGGEMAKPGGQVMDFPTGATMHFSRDTVHGGLTATSDNAIEFYTVHIVDTDKPLNVAAK